MLSLPPLRRCRVTRSWAREQAFRVLELMSTSIYCAIAKDSGNDEK